MIKAIESSPAYPSKTTETKAIESSAAYLSKNIESTVAYLAKNMLIRMVRMIARDISRVYVVAVRPARGRNYDMEHGWPEVTIWKNG